MFGFELRLIYFLWLFSWLVVTLNKWLTLWHAINSKQSLVERVKSSVSLFWKQKIFNKFIYYPILLWRKFKINWNEQLCMLACFIICFHLKCSHWLENLSNKMEKLPCMCQVRTGSSSRLSAWIRWPPYLKIGNVHYTCERNIPHLYSVTNEGCMGIKGS